jgi:hypothetical protein
MYLIFASTADKSAPAPNAFATIFGSGSSGCIG